MMVQRAISRFLTLTAGALISTSALAVVDEIIVTATKRALIAQDLPLAVSAFDASTLARVGVRDIRDLQILSPSLVLTSTQSSTSGTTARIRGVGTTGDNVGLESSVAVFIDGVYRNRNGVALTDLGELDRIEVLRGPQGTLFGKNASAGLIHIITKGPDMDEFDAYVQGSYGNYNEYNLAGGITGPVSENTGLRLDATWTQRDGLIEDALGSGTEYNDRDRYLLRGQLFSEITDDLDLKLIADYTDRDETCCAAVTYIAGPTVPAVNAAGGTVIVNPDDRKTTFNTNRGYEDDVKEYGVSAELNWNIGIGTLTSITAFRDWDSDRSMDIDFTNADLLYRAPDTNTTDFQTLTQELRYAFTVDSIDYLFGFYYVDETLDYKDAVRVGSGYNTYVNALIFGFGQAAGGLLPPGTIVDGQGVTSDKYQQDNSSWALFTHNTWHATDRLDVTLGVRYTDEDKDLSSTLIADNPACLRIAGFGPPLPLTPGGIGQQLTCNPLINPTVDGSYDGSVTNSEWSGTFNVAYDLAEGLLSYVSYGRGYKAGGFNLDRGGLDNPLLGQVPDVTDLEFEPETADTYELGLKATLLDGNLVVNSVYFYSTFDDFQLNTFTGTNFIVENIDSVTSKGIEVEAQATPMEQLTLAGGVTYTDATYDDPNSPLDGKRLTNAPYWVITTSATWEQKVTSSLDGFLNVGYRFQSDTNTGSDLLPEKQQGSFAVLNGSIGATTTDGVWRFELWGRNILDRVYKQVAFGAPLQTGTFGEWLGDPRMWGGTVRYNF